MNEIDAFSVDQLWDAVCLAHRVCDGCNRLAETFCSECGGAGPHLGRILALPGMQERCPGCGLQCDCVPGTDYHCKSHVSCHGTGFRAKRDLGALLEAAAKLVGNLVTIKFTAYDFGSRWDCTLYEGASERCLACQFGDTQVEAFLRAVADRLRDGQRVGDVLTERQLRNMMSRVKVGPGLVV